MTPTNEQQAVLDYRLNPGEMAKIVAYAGTGKTATLAELANKYSDKEVLYLAFNKSVEAEACNRFPFNTTCKTGHALAWHYVGKKFQIGNLYNWQLAKRYGLTIYEASLLLLGLESFCSSDAETPTEEHVEPDRLGKFSPERYVPGMVDKIRLAFHDLESGTLQMTHSGYLKLFQLQKKLLKNFRVILLDEAQDSNLVMLDIVRRQREHGARIYLVGDPYQQIYSWRGAVDAMSRADCPEFRITQSFRFGPAIADLATRLLSRFFAEQVPVAGTPTTPSWIDPPVLKPEQTYLHRTNAGIVRTAIGLEDSFTVNGLPQFEQFLEQVNQIWFLWDRQRDRLTEPRIKRFRSYNELVILAQETLDLELQLKASLVETYTSSWPDLYKGILSKVDATSRLILSTCHKAKGLEWDEVSLSDDFDDLFVTDGGTPLLKRVTRREPNASEIYSEEVNLIYVAITRARLALYLNQQLRRFNALTGQKPVNSEQKQIE